jgi:hypothetical protein
MKKLPLGDESASIVAIFEIRIAYNAIIIYYTA